MADYTDILSTGAGVAAPLIGGPAGIAVAAVPGLIKLFTAYQQNKKAKELANQKRPIYQIPKGITDNQALAQNEFMDNRVAGENQFINNTKGSTANNIQAAIAAGRGPGEIIAAANAATLGEDNAWQKLLGEKESVHASRLAGLEGANTALAGYQDKQWDYNTNQPYENSMKAAGALKQAANTNLFGGATGLADAALLAKKPLSDDWYKNYMSGSQGSSVIPRDVGALPQPVPQDSDIDQLVKRLMSLSQDR